MKRRRSGRGGYDRARGQRRLRSKLSRSADVLKSSTMPNITSSGLSRTAGVRGDNDGAGGTGQETRPIENSQERTRMVRPME